MVLISVNRGLEKTIRIGKSTANTGIFKIPVDSPVEITLTGLAGDAIVDAKNHGGVDQAVYVYTTPDYQWWSKELGKDLSPGTFGENLTVSGLESALVRVGDRLSIGAVVLEATAPRIPCSTLAARMGDPSFVKRFRSAARPGFYCRVIENGWVKAGDPVHLHDFSGQTVTILEMFHDFHDPDGDENKLRRFLNAPIDIRSRIEKEKQLSELLEN
jgi:MOSC domain-containing protein YiiM